jgi:hypothetical protein
MGARNLVGIGLSYQPARLHWLLETIPGLLKYLLWPEPVFVDLLKAQESIPTLRAGTTTLFVVPVHQWPHAQYIGWRNRFWGSVNVYKYVPSFLLLRDITPPPPHADKQCVIRSACPLGPGKLSPQI